MKVEMTSKRSSDFLNGNCISYPTDFTWSVGGNKEEWNILFLENISQNRVERLYPPMGGEGMVKQAYDLEKKFNVEKLRPKIDDSKLLIPLHIDPSKYETREELFKAIYNWWIKLKDRSEKTIKDRIRYARKMANHPIYPVNWFKFEPEQILNQLLCKQIYEYPEMAKKTSIQTYGVCQLHNDWKTVNTFAEAYGEDISYWGYSPPGLPEPQVKIVPRPHIVHQLMNYKFSSDRFTNVLIKTIITVGFHIGWRPSEAVIQRVDDIYFDEGYLIIREPKKKHRPRQVWIDERVMNCRRQNSLSNFVHIWRPRHATKQSGDFLFIQEDGKPFPTAEALRMFLAPYCKPVWNPFCLKIMRDWSAIARLIRTKIETKKWDIRIVKNDLGHQTENTTETYVKYAEDYYRRDPYDWLRAVLKFHKSAKKHCETAKQVEPNHLDLKIEKQQKMGVCGQSLRRKINAPIGIRTRV